MSSSRIEQIIEEIEEYVENCRYQPLSTTKIIVNKEELEELLRELRLKTPDEIKRYQTQYLRTPSPRRIKSWRMRTSRPRN